MADRYLLESGSPDGYLNEDGGGVLILEGVTNLTLDIDTAGAITVAGQSVTLGLGLPVANGAVTVAGQSVGLGLGLPLSAGAVTVAGQAIGLGLGLPLTDGAIAVAGQSVGLDVGLSVENGAIAISGQSVDLSLTTIFEFDAGSITIAGQDVSLSLAAAPASAEQPSGGWWQAFERDYERHKARRKREEEENAEIEAIPDVVSREIAQLLREQEAKDAERAELERLRSIARSYDGGEIDAKFNRALEVAANARSLAAARVLAQEVARVREEEEFLMTAALLVIDD